MQTELRWRKSSYSSNQGNCVEVAELPDGGMAVRDTKDRDGATLRFDAGAWGEFIASIKSSQAATSRQG
jgi:Domain of unknown function (DUF397)